MVRVACCWMLDAGYRMRDAGFWPLTLDFASQREPRRQILLRTFLCLKSLRYDDNRMLWNKIPQQGDEERLGRGTDARARQHPPLLQTPCQGLHGGSFQDSSEQFACRCDC